VDDLVDMVSQPSSGGVVDVTDDASGCGGVSKELGQDRFRDRDVALHGQSFSEVVPI
jgi:hypothetical protein